MLYLFWPFYFRVLVWFYSAWSVLRWLLGGELQALSSVHLEPVFAVGLEWDPASSFQYCTEKQTLFLAGGLDLILVFATVTSVTGTKSHKCPLVPTHLGTFATNTCLGFPVTTTGMLRMARTNKPSRTVEMGKSCNLQSVWSPGWSLKAPHGSNWLLSSWLPLQRSAMRTRPEVDSLVLLT